MEYQQPTTYIKKQKTCVGCSTSTTYVGDFSPDQSEHLNSVMQLQKGNINKAFNWPSNNY